MEREETWLLSKKNKKTVRRLILHFLFRKKKVGDAVFNIIKWNGEIIGNKTSVAMASSDMKPKSISRAKKWSEEIENLYRFQQAGYRDEIEYKQVKQVSMVDRWPETGYVKKLQRRDNTFYYYNKQRECDDKEVHKVKIYAY
ncbi:meiosis expressed gene 1 protein homolog isoform X1 [Phoca vitulina]|nr:meiosis expressed gene 1 protein homolog isoform X1 [Phoca vitulina]